MHVHVVESLDATVDCIVEVEDYNVDFVGFDMGCIVVEVVCLEVWDYAMGFDLRFVIGVGFVVVVEDYVEVVVEFVD